MVTAVVAGFIAVHVMWWQDVEKKRIPLAVMGVAAVDVSGYVAIHGSRTLTPEQVLSTLRGMPADQAAKVVTAIAYVTRPEFDAAAEPHADAIAKDAAILLVRRHLTPPAGELSRFVPATRSPAPQDDEFKTTGLGYRS